MKLIVMTAPTFFVEEDKILTSLFDEGMDSLHLYKPHSSPLFAERLLMLLREDDRSKITIHETFRLKKEYGLRGIHIDDAATPVPDGYRGRVTRTCDSLDEARETKRQCDYVFLNNTFGKTDKDTSAAPLTAEELADGSRRGIIDRRVYAYGGVTEDNIRMARELGFGGVVVCDDLWEKFNIHTGTDYKELMRHFDKLRRLAS